MSARRCMIILIGIVLATPVVEAQRDDRVRNLYLGTGNDAVINRAWFLDVPSIDEDATITGQWRFQRTLILDEHLTVGGNITATRIEATTATATDIMAGRVQATTATATSLTADRIEATTITVERMTTTYWDGWLIETAELRMSGDAVGRRGYWQRLEIGPTTASARTVIGYDASTGHGVMAARRDTGTTIALIGADSTGNGRVDLMTSAGAIRNRLTSAGLTLASGQWVGLGASSGRLTLVDATRDEARWRDAVLYVNADGIGTTATDGLVLENTTAAASGAQQMPPRIHFRGQGWRTNAPAGSQRLDWVIDHLPVEGTSNPTSRLGFWYSINNSSYFNAMTLLATAGSARATRVGINGSPYTSLTVIPLDTGAGIYLRGIGDTGEMVRINAASSPVTHGIIEITRGGSIDTKLAGDGNKYVAAQSGNFGIGDSTPAALLTVGNGDLFQVSSGGAVSTNSGANTSYAGTTTGLAPMTLTSTDAGASAAVLTLDRNSASPAASDLLFSIQFKGRSSTGATRTYGSIETTIDSPTNGAEYATLGVKVIANGSVQTPLVIHGGLGSSGLRGVTVNQAIALTPVADLTSTSGFPSYHGILAVDSTDGRLKYWDGSAWHELAYE